MIKDSGVRSIELRHIPITKHTATQPCYVFLTIISIQSGQTANDNSC